MKRIMTGLLLLHFVATQAQNGTLVPDEVKKMMAEYFPMGEQGFLYKAYDMDLDTFLLTMKAYKTRAYSVLDQSTVESKSLAKKEIDFYCLSRLKDYYLYYGTDSLKQAAYYKLFESKGASRGALDSAYRSISIKRFTPPQRILLDSLCHKNIDMNDSALFVNSAVYRAYLSHVVSSIIYTAFRNDFMARVDNSLIQLKVVNRFIHNPHIHNYFVYTITGQIIQMSKDSVMKDSVYHAFIEHATDADYRRRIDSIYTNYLAFGNNKPAPDFTYASVKGKKVSLASLRGKYVYIDIWATWCGPCKKEFPYLMEVEKSYKGRKIHFVSLSVDAPKDKDKWQKYVLDNHLEGLQLITDNAFDSDFIKKFNIAAIPRFILIGPDGKIISADAKRPSDPALRTQLDSLL